jgi:membrane fusion protein, multidrug efflux system
VVDGENKVHYRQVKTGALQEDGLRVISQGLKADEEVVVGGLQLVRPEAIIQPEHRTMPSLAPTPPPGLEKPINGEKKP